MKRVDEVLCFKGVHFSYHKKEPLLKNISFTLHRGEKGVIIGENGAGKTTLLKLLTHQEHPTDGEILFCGKNIHSKSSYSLVHKEISYLPQIQMMPEIAIEVGESVLLGLWGKSFAYLKRSSKHDRKKAIDALKMVGMEDFVNKDLRTLSGGERQKVAIARAIIRTPTLLLLDEPTTYLDKESKLELYTLMNNLQQELSFTMLIISHEPLYKKEIERVFYLNNQTLIEDEEI